MSMWLVQTCMMNFAHSFAPPTVFSPLNISPVRKVNIPSSISFKILGTDIWGSCESNSLTILHSHEICRIPCLCWHHRGQNTTWKRTYLLILVLILACNAVYLAKHLMIQPSMDTLCCNNTETSVKQYNYREGIMIILLKHLCPISSLQQKIQSPIHKQKRLQEPGHCTIHGKIKLELLSLTPCKVAQSRICWNWESRKGMANMQRQLSWLKFTVK
jgi:hypothetical protein